MLESLLGSKDRERVLQFLLSKEKGYASEIARFYDTHSSQIIKQLASLEVGGVTISFQIGRARVYELNPRYYFLQELKVLLLKARECYRPEEIERLMMDKRASRRKGKTMFILESAV